MVMQAEQIARWADGRHLAFIGDGDAISNPPPGQDM